MLEKMPTRKGVLEEWAWRPAYATGNHWLVMKGLHPEQMLPQGVGYWSPWLATVPGAEVTVSLRLRGTDLAPTEKGSPAIWLQFVNETGQHRQRAHLLGRDAEGQARHAERLSGSYDWTELRETVLAPEGAVRMALFFGMLPCTGEVGFDDIDLTTASE